MDPVAGWLAVLPLKPPSVAKSRLRGALPGVPHADLVVAMALDTVAAVLACTSVAEVVLVCDDPAVRAEATALGAGAVADEPAAGLNAAALHGAAQRHGYPVAVLTADLPALRPSELAQALAAARAAGGGAFVPDRAGTGTVLLAAGSAAELTPAFGAGSAAAHRAAGARPLGGAWPGLRGDVDTGSDLAAAAALGPGRRTCALLASAHRYGY